jgi:hypothetical protein
VGGISESQHNLEDNDSSYALHFTVTRERLSGLRSDISAIARPLVPLEEIPKSFPQLKRRTIMSEGKKLTTKPDGVGRGEEGGTNWGWALVWRFAFSVFWSWVLRSLVASEHHTREFLFRDSCRLTHLFKED